MKLDITWADDCQGKKDYDGDIVAVSTRYWPSNHQKNGMCSAICDISMYDGFLDRNGESELLISKNFEGATFAQVAEQVEPWAQAQMDRIAAALRAEFNQDA
ncbi:hypothetical protein V3O24_04425 [Methylobacter sp. Wu8]|uniref:hypothetical protein n=1 Tax=Methylobacter sp. Wu8 TaxID=3118457 RepID=UPI002F2C6137